MWCSSLTRPLQGCNETLRNLGRPDFYRSCKICKRSHRSPGYLGIEYRCKDAWHYSTLDCFQYTVCGDCYRAQRSQTLQDCSDATKHETFLHCPGGTSLSLMLPSDVVSAPRQLQRDLLAAVRDTPSALAWVATTTAHTTEPAQQLERLDAVAQGLPSTHEPGSAGWQSAVRQLLGKPADLDTLVKEAVAKLDCPVAAELRAEPASQHESEADAAAAASTAQHSALLTGARSDVSFSVMLEFRLPVLPREGQRAALLRFAPPPVTPGRQAKRQEASIYVGHDGLLGVCSLLQTAVAASPGATEPTSPGDILVRPGRWHVLVVTVDCDLGRLCLFVDGVPTQQFVDSSSSKCLALGARIVLFGGGKQVCPILLTCVELVDFGFALRVGG
eukprot:COSAG01_NODE_1610_length_9742_cov_5.134709_1_plen_388_part_00